MAAKTSNTSPAQTSFNLTIERARAIANQNQTPLQEAQSTIGVLPASPIPPIQSPEVSVTSYPTTPVQTEQPGRSPGGKSPYVSPVIQTSAGPVINRAYIETIPPIPTGPDTASVVISEVDKLIEDSNEVVDAIIANIDVTAPPVILVQDILTPPNAVTPTEIILEHQANCEKALNVGSTVINIVNENIINLDTGTDVSASIVLTIAVDISRGCTDPDAVNYDPTAVIDDESCEYTLKEEDDIIEDIEDIEDIKDIIEVVKPIIPLMSRFIDSHGQVVFEVPRELVESRGIIKMPPGNNVKVIATEEITSPNYLNPIVRFASFVDSDLVLTPEEPQVGNRKYTRRKLTELASDNPLPSDKQVIIYNEVDTKQIVRNKVGAIVITTNSPILKTSLQSQAFTYKGFTRTINTSFNELVGKM